MKRWFVAVLLVIGLAGPAFAEKWAFTVISDNRSGDASYRNVLNEIRTQKVNPEERFPLSDFVVIGGDLDPAEESLKTFREIFRAGKPLFVPVRGNHEQTSDVEFIIRKVLPSLGDSLKQPDRKNVNYYWDWKNTRLIVLDQYSRLGKYFDGDSELKWVEKALLTPDNIHHVFIAFHEPYLPQHPEEDPFWKLLLSRQDKVRAVFCGHTHMYRSDRFPDNPTGITYVNTGNAGQRTHSDNKQTMVEVMIDGSRVVFRVIQAPDGTSEFRLRDQWELKSVGGERSQSDGRCFPVLVKAEGNCAGHCVVP